MTNEILEHLKTHDVFSTFNEDLLFIIAKNSVILDVEKDHCVLHEDHPDSQHFFLVLKGTCGLFKRDVSTQDQFLLTNFQKDDIFGETSAFSEEKGLFTVQALDSAKLLQVPLSILKTFEKSKELKKYYAEVVTRLSEIISNKLNMTYENYFHVLREEKRRKALQKESNIFLIGICIIFGIGMAMDHIVTMFYLDVKSILFNWIYILIILLPIIIFIKIFSYPLREFGITTRNLLPSVQTGLTLTGLLWIGGIFGITLKSVDVDLPFYQQILTEVVKNTPAIYVLSYLAHSYIQEFIARGVIQTTLQKFLEDERGLKANMITSGLFAIFHIHRGIGTVLITFLASFAFGWVYIKDRNLAGVTLFHWSIGTVSRLMGGI